MVEQSLAIDSEKLKRRENSARKLLAKKISSPPNTPVTVKDEKKEGSLEAELIAINKAKEALEKIEQGK